MGIQPSPESVKFSGGVLLPMDAKSYPYREEKR